mmetsp:Transcript_12873/g.16921  ORF Transcript_12873/g.16921 Transcript_12873/m.16921 type:complete len:105 (-) Transcript_12873:26-340(-)
MVVAGQGAVATTTMATITIRTTTTTEGEGAVEEEDQEEVADTTQTSIQTSMVLTELMPIPNSRSIEEMGSQLICILSDDRSYSCMFQTKFSAITLSPYLTLLAK